MKENKKTFILLTVIYWAYTVYTFTQISKYSESVSRQCKNRKLLKLKFDFDTQSPLSNSDCRKECPLIIIIFAGTIHQSIQGKQLAELNR